MPTLGIGPEWLPLSPLATPRMYTSALPGPFDSNDTLGRYCAKSSNRMTLSSSRRSVPSAWIASGTSCRLSWRFCAVTTISSRPPELVCA